MAILFNQNGWKVFATGRNEEKLKSLDAECSNKNLITHAADLLDPKNNSTMVGACHKALGVIDVVFLGAGFGASGKIGEGHTSRISDMVNINLISPYLTLDYITPILKKQKSGHVCVLSSVAGQKYSPGYTMYSATKFAITAIIEGYRNEVQDFGIRTTVINPGIIDTPLWETFGSSGEAVKFEEEFMIKAEDVANLVWTVTNMPEKVAINDATIRPIRQVR